MKMETENDINRVGIYTQVSVEVTATGEGLAPQGEKSPVASNNRNPDISNETKKAKDVNMSANESQCSDNVSDVDQLITNPDDSFRNNGNEDEFKDDDSTGENGGSRFREERYDNMRHELMKLNFTNYEVNAMQAALETERKRRHHNKMPRYCEENNLDEKTAKQRMLERNERDIAMHKAQKVEREAARAIMNIGYDFKNEKKRQNQFDMKRRDRTRADINSKQTGKRKKGDPNIFFISPAIRSGSTDPSFANRDRGSNSDDSMQPESSNRRIWSPNQRYSSFGDSRDRSPSPLNQFRRDEEFEEVRRRMGLSESDEREISPYLPKIDSTERSLSAFSRSYNLSQPPKLLGERFKIEVQIVNKADLFGRIREENLQLLLELVEKSVHDERDMGVHRIEIGECVYKKMILHVHCRNYETVNYLEQKIAFFNRIMPGADYYLAREKVHFGKKKVSVYLNNYNLTSEEFFKIIKKQNDYPVEAWTLLPRGRQKQSDIGVRGRSRLV